MTHMTEVRLEIAELMIRKHTERIAGYEKEPQTQLIVDATASSREKIRLYTIAKEARISEGAK